jgi:hypothetical protein
MGRIKNVDGGAEFFLPHATFLSNSAQKSRLLCRILRFRRGEIFQGSGLFRLLNRGNEFLSEDKGSGGGLCDLDQKITTLQGFEDSGPQRREPLYQFGVGAVADAQSDYRRTWPTRQHPVCKVLILAESDGLMLHGVVSQVIVGTLSHRQFEHMIHFMACIGQAGQALCGDCRFPPALARQKIPGNEAFPNF